MAGRPKINYKRCIGNYFCFKSMDLIRYFGKWKTNLFPYVGAYYEQPAKFVESMELIDNLTMQKNSERENQLKGYKR